MYHHPVEGKCSCQQAFHRFLLQSLLWCLTFPQAQRLSWLHLERSGEFSPLVGDMEAQALSCHGILEKIMA